MSLILSFSESDVSFLAAYYRKFFASSITIKILLLKRDVSFFIISTYKNNIRVALDNCLSMSEKVSPYR